MALSGSRGMDIVVFWLGVSGVRGGEGMWYATEKVVAEESEQWKSAISGWVPTNMLLKVPSEERLRRIYRLS